MKANKIMSDEDFVECLFLEELNDDKREVSIVAVFCNRLNRKSEMMRCYSLNEGHSEGSRTYFKSLKFAEGKRVDDIIRVLKENYNYNIKNANPF